MMDGAERVECVKQAFPFIFFAGVLVGVLCSVLWSLAG
jgi:hypothetical protein